MAPNTKNQQCINEEPLASFPMSRHVSCLVLDEAEVQFR